MNKIHIDFETRSRTNLKTDGVYNYASCPTTEIICMSWAFGGGEPSRWQPIKNPGEPFPEQLAKYIRDGVPLRAHNAAFERLMFELIVCPEQGLPPIPLEQWHCTAFQARCNNLPGSLFDGARCLGVKQQKDRAGRNLIQMLSIPQPGGEFNEDPSLLEEMAIYCDQDVRAERDIGDKMREPTAEEWNDYWTSERINDRGIRVDIELARAAQQYAAEEEADIINLVTELSDGAITKFRGPALLAWVTERIEPHHLDSLRVYRGDEKKYSLDKWSRHRLMDHEDLDPVVREVVAGADTAYRSSVGKYRALEHRADPEDHRMRGAFVANGASQSGRFASWGAQLHNFPRAALKNWDEAREDLVDNVHPEDIVDYFEMPIMDVLSGMLRPTLMSDEGNVFLISDWSAIEGRCNPWLAGSPEGEKKLDLYRKGVDVYQVAAAEIYMADFVEDDPEQRQVGKVAELALGFGGGAGAFLAMARSYGVTVSKADADFIKDRWRRGNPWAVRMWSACEKAAMAAVRNPGDQFSVGRVTYFALQGVLAGGTTLFCELPCGRLLTYPDTRIEQKIAPWGAPVPALTALRANWTPKTTEREWPRAPLWGGLLVENITQATAASLLRHALSQADRRGLSVVLHVHDELVVESPESQADADAEILREIMNTAPAWAEGLPIQADVETKRRFGK